MALLQEEIRNVTIPDHDPVYGKDGPLVLLWRKVSRQNNL